MEEIESETPGMSVAESMWKRRRNRTQSVPESEAITPLQGTVSTKAWPEVIQRLSYVVDQIVTLAPNEVQSSWQFKTVAAMIQEARKDFRRLPEDQVEEFARMVGNAFLWVADGDIADVEPATEYTSPHYLGGPGMSSDGPSGDSS